MGLQRLMRHFTIRTRMLGAIGVVALLLLLVGAAGLWGMSRLHAMSQDFVDHAFQKSQALSRLQATVVDLDRHEKSMVIHYDAPASAAQAQADWRGAHERASAQLSLMLQGEDEAGQAVWRQMQAQLAAYAAAVEPVAAQIQASAYDTAAVANRMLARADEQHTDLLNSLLRQQALLADHVQNLNQRAQNTSQQTLALFALAIALAALVVVPTTMLNMHSICLPLERAQRLATSISQGDLTQPIDASGRDELAALMQALADMQSALARIVGEVRSSTDGIGIASAQIASGNLDLSGRTEQAASSLQQTAASVAQINSTLRQSADAAGQASQMALANAEVAARGGKVVGEVVATMEEINHSSKKISDIIGVIDGIAFQTNILALNAAVEAARAGEQGRGFAVVAAEVRSLAQRSAQAAKEIKGLIGASVERVETGARLVADAGHTIGEIVANADKVSAFINDISTATREQSSGIGQVNTAVSQLDQMTQQNAALVEESAAAAQSLKDQALRLAEVVRVFRLTGQTPAQA